MKRHLVALPCAAVMMLGFDPEASLRPHVAGTGDGRPVPINDNGDVVFRVKFIDGSEGIFTTASIPCAAGDVDCDGAIDLDDYTALADCMSGPDALPGSENCVAFDVDGDGDVDLADYGAFSNAFGR